MERGAPVGPCYSWPATSGDQTCWSLTSSRRANSRGTLHRSLFPSPRRSFQGLSSRSNSNSGSSWTLAIAIRTFSVSYWRAVATHRQSSAGFLRKGLRSSLYSYSRVQVLRPSTLCVQLITFVDIDGLECSESNSGLTLLPNGRHSKQTSSKLCTVTLLSDPRYIKMPWIDKNIDKN